MVFSGFNGNTIGGNATDMLITDGVATKMALHCSFEHFEGDEDIRFIKEADKVLRGEGKMCILPLYLFNTMLFKPTHHSYPKEVYFLKKMPYCTVLKAIKTGMDVFMTQSI